ncbi:class I SAM-dependent RNA methyltransferase [Marinovum sp.]|uniref:class I SAM-dependent RNA methyltransferase n=1 Tax=Marinovum sp. TaxID=2024839 RepID=UPI002B275FAC|nr:class I SAM-dependent RNA methyltransferase [Marinovum sp.]
MTQHDILRLGHQGDGIAHGPLFAPLTLPGETVSGTIDGDRLRDVKILAPSEHRVAPPCRHFKACGGCQLMHASDGFVAGWKQQVVQRALAAQGIEAAFRPIETSPPQSRRRATFSARRTKKGAMAGFHGRASGVIVEIPDCHLLHPDLLAARPVAEALAALGGSRKGELSVQITLSEDGLDVLARGGKPLDRSLEVALAELAGQHPIARLVWEDEPIAMRTPPGQRFDGIRVVPPPGAFLQATAHGQQVLTAAMVEAVGKAEAVADLFAGCGTFALPMARSAEVHAVEGEAAMLTALDAGWRRAEGLKKVTTETRDLFRNPLLPAELARFDAVVLDPPRAGAEAQVRQLAESTVKVLGVVSCNPVTFARDAAVLIAGGYRLDWVQVVDQFRWSSHIELAVRFTRAHI